jgi:membrane protein YdbS with pleckstrin-like domain
VKSIQALGRNSIPFIFFAVISAFWAFFYKSSNVMNEFGADKPEWLLFIDGLIVLPILCFVCVKDKKEATIKAVAYSGLIILLGSFVIPESSKSIWPYLESGRYLVIFAFVALEVITIITVFFAIKTSLTKLEDPDIAISRPIENIVGKGVVSTLLSFEARVWTYALFSRKIRKQHFDGEIHFSCHNKDGTQSNQLGFIIIILFELPVMHVLLHFLWSPYAANIITGLTLLGLVFFIAEYKAIAIRPISLTPDSIIIRYGVWNPLTIPITQIKHLGSNSKFIRRSANLKRFNLSAAPNVEIKLNSGKFIYLGVDSPDQLILTFEKIRETLT